MTNPLNIFGDKPATLSAFQERPVGGDDFRLAEHVGKGVIVEVLGPKEVQTNLYGVKTAMNVNVVVLEADGSGKKYEDVLIFNAAPLDQLKGLAGQTIIAQVTTYKSKQGTQAPKFEAPSEAVVAAANKYAA